MKYAVIIFIVSNITVFFLMKICRKYFAKNYLKLEEEVYNLKQKIIDLQEKQQDAITKENTRKSFINIDRSNIFNLEQKNSFIVNVNKTLTTCNSYFKYDFQKNDIRFSAKSNIDQINMNFPAEWLQFIIVNLVYSILNLLPKSSNISISINYIKPDLDIQVAHSGISFLWEELEEFNSFTKNDEGIYPLKEIVDILKQNNFEVCYKNKDMENILELKCYNIVCDELIIQKDNVLDLSNYKKQYLKPVN